MATKVEMSTESGVATAAATALDASTSKIPFAIKELGDPADITEAFRLAWTGGTVNNDFVAGIPNYIKDINDRLKDIECVLGPSTLGARVRSSDAVLTVNDEKFKIGNARFETSAVSSAKTFNLAEPSGASDTVVLAALNQALTNKTINKVTITTPANSATLTLADGKTLTVNKNLTLDGVDGKTLTLNKNLTLDGVDGKTLTVNKNLTLDGVDDKALTVNKNLTLDGVDGKTLTLNNSVTLTATDSSPVTVAFGAGGTVTYTSNKLSAFSATTSAELAGVIIDETGSGSLVFANTPTLITPVLGIATATSINKVTITAPATGAELKIADGKTLTANSTLTLAGADSKTLTVNNTLTFGGNDNASIAFGAGGTVLYSTANGGVGVAPSDLNATLTIAKGGTGLSTAPTTNQVLLGKANGTYELTSTPTLSFLTVGPGGVAPALQVNGNLTVSGNYVVQGTTQYANANITSGSISASANVSITLDTISPVYSATPGETYYTGAEYIIVATNSSGRTTYRAVVSAFSNGTASRNSSVTVYAETTTTGGPLITAFDTTSLSGPERVDFKVTVDAASTISYYRVAIKEIVP